MGWFLREIFNFIDFNMKVENKKSTVKMLTNFFDSSSRITYRKFKILIDKINSIRSNLHSAVYLADSHAL